MLIIVSNMAVDLLMDALRSIIRGVLINIDVDVLFSGVITAFDFAMPGPLAEFRCWTAFDCRPVAALDCASVLQARMPSYHV